MKHRAVIRRADAPKFGSDERGLLGVVKRALWRVLARKSGWDGDMDQLAREIVQDIQQSDFAQRDALSRITEIINSHR